MIYPHTVTFQSPTPSQMPSGQVIHTYEDVVALTDLAARIVPEQEDEQADRMVIETDRQTIIVQGDRAVDVGYRVVSDFLDSTLEVVRVQRPVLYGSNATNATLVTAERIAADTEEVS